MGRSFQSVRLGVRFMAERWKKVAGKLGRDDRGPGALLTGYAKTHSSEAFFGCDTPLEAVIFSALVEIQKKQAERGDDDVDP